MIKILRKEIDNYNFKLLVLGDLHIGDKYCDYDLIDRTIDYIKAHDDIYVIVNGDMMNNAIIGSKSDAYSETMTMGEEIEKAVEVLKPIKHRILAIASGNHEVRTYRVAGVDTSQIVAGKLGIEDLWCESTYVVNVRCRRKYDNATASFNIFGTHGSRGGGRTMGAKTNSINDLSKIVVNADLYVKSHTHQNVFFPDSYFHISKNDVNLIKRNRYYFNAGSFLMYGGYAQRNEYAPSNTNVYVLNIEHSSRTLWNSERNKSDKERQWIVNACGVL